jgi:hypothetical protein
MLPLLGLGPTVPLWVSLARGGLDGEAFACNLLALIAVSILPLPNLPHGLRKNF